MREELSKNGTISYYKWEFLQIMQKTFYICKHSSLRMIKKGENLHNDGLHATSWYETYKLQGRSETDLLALPLNEKRQKQSFAGH